MTVLSVIWFILIAVLWTLYLVLEGFDFGVGMLRPFVAKNRAESTAVVRTIGPHWDGNEVWLLTAGGATFAAFPLWYATWFSGMYMALFLVLVLLILRIVALEWRSKVHSDKWVSTWDWFTTIASYGVPLVLGVAFSNFVSGMQIVAQTRGVVDGRLVMTTIEPTQVSELLDSGTVVFNLIGGFWSLFTPYSLLGGVMLVAVCFAHGAQYLSLKTEGAVLKRVNAIVAPASIISTTIAAVWVLWGQLAYSSNRWAWLPLLLAAVAFILSTMFSQSATRRPGLAFTFSAIGVGAAVAWVFSSMAPYVMKSSIDPAYSLSIGWASSTQPTLTVMLVVALLLVPLILAYTVWAYWVFRGRISSHHVDTYSGLIPDKIRPKTNFLTGKQG